MAWYDSILGRKKLKNEVRELSAKIGQLEQRSSYMLTNPTWLSSLMSESGVKGMNVNRNTALSIAAVWRAVWLISGTVASIPFHIYKKNGDRWERDDTHPLYNLLNKKPNDIYNAFNFKQIILLHLLLDGNAYVRIDDDSLDLLDYRNVDPYIFKNRKYYRVLGQETVMNDEMCHFMGLSFGVDAFSGAEYGYGVKGLSPIQAAYGVHSGALAQTKYTNKFYENGAAPSGVVEVDGELSDPAYQRMKSSFQEAYGGLDNIGKTPIMEGGSKYKAISINPRDAMIIESKELTVRDIGRIYGVPPYLLYGDETATYASAESLSQEVINYGIKPRVELLEAELNTKFFPDKDIEVRGDMDALLRGNSEARASLYDKLFYTGAMSPNEIRKAEGLNPYAGGDQRFIQVNMMPVVEDMKNPIKEKEVKL
ncbi:MAG: phage portal protein [Flavobacteriaceae bacterium]